MERAQVERALQSVGKRVFIEHFGDFGDLNLSVGEVADRLSRSFTLKARSTRASHVRRIFVAGLERHALSLIVESRRVSQDIRDRAEELLGQS